MTVGEGRDARPNRENERCGRGDRAQNDMVLRNIGGWKEGSGSVITTVTVSFFFFFFFSFFFFFFFKSYVHCFYDTRNDMHL